MINGLPERLKALRAQYGLSQSGVAKRLGVSPSVVSGYETGERTPSTEIILKLAAVYNVSTDYLLGHKNADTEPSINLSGLTPSQISAIIALVEAIKNT